MTILNTEKISPSQELGRGYRYLLLLSLINPVPEGDNLQTTYMTRVFSDKPCSLTERGVLSAEVLERGAYGRG